MDEEEEDELPLNATYPGWGSLMEKYRNVGTPDPKVTELAAATYQWENPAPFCNIDSSWKLRHAFGEEQYCRYRSRRLAAASLVSVRTVDSSTRRSSVGSAHGPRQSLIQRGSTSVGASHKLLALEAGSPLRFITGKSASASQLDCGTIPLPNNLALVSQGLEELSQRELLSPKSRRRSPASTLRRTRVPTLSTSSSFGMSGMSFSSSSSCVSPSRRQVVLSGFSRWCSDNFGSVKNAWSCLMLKNNPLVADEDSAQIDSATFMRTLRDNGYPFGDMGAKMVFRLMDTDRRGSCSLADVNRALSDIPAASTMDEPDAEEPHLDSDSAYEFEDGADRGAATSHQDRRSAMLRRQKETVQRLLKEDPLIGEFLDFLFSAYRTLKVAYTALDVNLDGGLSKTEFSNGLKSMRARDGRRPLDSHIENLWKRLRGEGIETVLMEELVRAGKSADPFVARFGKFLTEVTKAHLAVGDTAALKLWLQTKFKADSEVRQSEFMAALTELGYPDWHIDDLFALLDKDFSGELSFEEFSALMVVDVRQRKKGFRPATPLGDKQRQKRIFEGYSTSEYSVKLMDVDKARAPTKSPANKAGIQLPGSFSEPFTSGLPAEKMGFSQIVKRPDYIDMMRAKLKRRGQLHQTGEHVLSRNPAPLSPIAVADCGIAGFEDTATREQMNGIV